MLLTTPSRSVDGTCTTENLMVFWAEWFGRFHRESPHYVPYELKTLDYPLLGAGGLPLLDREGRPCLMRCVREIARREVNGEIEWLLISWFVGLPGVLFKECGSLVDAHRAFNAAVEPLQIPDDSSAWLLRQASS